MADQISKTYPHHLLRTLNPCHTLDPMSPMSRQPENFDMEVHYRKFQDYYNYCKGTGWEPCRVARERRRGFEMAGRLTRIVEQMAQIWDVFAQASNSAASRRPGAGEISVAVPPLVVITGIFYLK